MAGYKKGSVKKINVERVVDWDTVRIRRGGFWGALFPGPSVSVRLYGMDAPESNQKNGDRSTNALRKMVRRGGFRMEVMDTDQYGRVVGLLYRDDRMKSVNYRMVEDGWAHAYVRYGGSELRMDEAEREAKRRKLGIWKGRGPAELPESWRRRHGGSGRSWWRSVLFYLVATGIIAVLLFILWRLLVG